MLLFLLSTLYVAQAATFVPPLRGEVLPVNSSRVVRGLLECRCSPTFKRPRNDSLAIINATLTDIASMAGNATRATTARAALEMCTTMASLEDCINADAALRDTHTKPLCSYDKMGGINLFRTNNVYTHTGTCRLVHSSPTAAAAVHLNEGCVAVEHLRGAVHQYLWPLRRPVVCRSSAYGVLCATANHAIIYRGHYTSLTRLCAAQRWHGCWRSVALVNNMRVTVNRRLRVSPEIVLTPYDVRFPKAATWVAQLSQDALVLVAGAVFAFHVVALLTYCYSYVTNYCLQSLALD